jgi:hypothetical protein
VSLLADLEAELYRKDRVPVPDWLSWVSEDAPRIPSLVMCTRAALEPPKRWRRWMPAEDLPYQATELAGVYLRAISRLQLPKRRPEHFLWRQRRDTDLLLRQPPRYWQGGAVEGELAYIDLDRAYWQIYSPATLDLIYEPDTGRASAGRVEWLESKEPWFRDDKQVRNYVVGKCRRRYSARVVGDAVNRVEGGNHWLQPHLWAWIQDTLGAVAAEAVLDFGACLAASDGVILPLERAEEWREHLASRWHLTSRWQARGWGVVQGPGCWQIGEERARAQPTPHPTAVPFPRRDVREGLRRNREWLLEHVTTL